MKSPATPRPKKPPSPLKLKLLCSFGGAFVPREPTGELRYSGGETRILAVDRHGIDLWNLRWRLSELCPDCSLSLKYQLVGAPSRTELISIETDDDVRLMVEDYDRFVTGGKASRLRVFLCDPSPSPSGSVAPQNLLTLSVDGSCSRFLGFRGGKVLESGTALGVLNQDANLRGHGNSCQSLGAKVFGTQITSTHVNAIQYPGDSMVNASRMGNHGSSNDASFSGFREGLACQRVSAACCMGQACCHGSLSSSSHTIEPHPRKTVNANSGKMNRENVIPCNTAETCLTPVSFSSQSYRRILQSKFFCVSNGLSSISQPRGRNHLFGGNEIQGHQTFQYNTRVSQSGSNDSVAEQISNGRCCLPKCHRGQSPRSIIPRLIQGTAHQSCLGKPMGVRSNKGVLRKHVVQPVEEKNLAPKPPNGRGGLPAMNFAQQKHQGDTENFICSHFLGNVTGGFDLLCNSGVGKHVTQSHVPYPYSPFDDTLQCTTNGSENSCFATTTEHDSCDLNKELGFVGSVKSGHADALLSDFSRSCSAHDNDVAKVGTKLRDVTTIPKSDLKGELDIFEPVDAVSSSSSLMDLCSHKLPSNLSTHQLFLCSSADATPEPFSSHSSNIPESDACGPGIVVALQKHESCIQLNKEDFKESKTFYCGPLIENRAEDTDKEHINDRTDISSKGAKEFSQPPSLGVVEISPGTEEVMPSYMEDKANVVKSTNNCCKEAGEAISKLPAVYSHLATQELQVNDVHILHFLKPVPLSLPPVVSETIKNCDLEEIKELGSGTYGTVSHGKWKGSDVAIKRLKPSCFGGGELGEERLIADFWKEARLLAQLHHPNVVAFYGVVSDGPVTNLATVTEYMVNGSLKQVLQRKDRIIDRRKRLIIAMDAAFGMEYLHEKNIVHFDLKSQNFLVNMKDPHRPVCKIGDLGLSKVKRRTLVSGGVRGTIPWMAPELLSSDSNMVTEKVDVYSFGIVMWELLTGEEPYRIMHSKEIIAGIIKGDLRPEIPSWCDPAWRSLMERCWSSNPASRPAFSEISKELRAIAASINIK